MAKGNGTTRKGSPVSPKGLTSGAMSPFIPEPLVSEKQVSPERIALDRKDFYSYDSSWEHTYFDEKTGGYLVTQLSRKYKDLSNNDRETFLKEQKMGMKYASFGFQIEHLDETTGISSPDARVRRHGKGTGIIVNGHYADFKSSISGNNIVDYAKHATRDQGAEFVFLEFTSHHKKIPSAIRELVSNNIHGYYYYSDENNYHSF